MMTFFYKGAGALTVVSLLALPLGSVAAETPRHSNGPIEARDPSLEISGETNVLFFAFNGHEKEQSNGKGQGSHMTVQDSRLNFRFAGATEALGGLDYTGFIGLAGNTEDGNNPVEENWIMLRNRWGRLIAGHHKGVSDRMAYGAFSLMGSTGGFDGSYKNVINISTGVVRATDLAGTQKFSNTLTLVTPRVNGVQAGFSFTPDGEQKGEAKLRTASSRQSKVTPYDKNSLEFGLNYQTSLSGVGIKTSAVLVTGQTQSMRRQKAGPFATSDVRFAETLFSGKRHKSLSYGLGLVLTYGNFEAGFEFVDNGKSQVLKSIKGRDAGKLYMVATSYTFGANKVALGYQISERKLGTHIEHFGATDTISPNNPKAKAKVASITYDRKIAKGLSLFAEANYFDFKTDKRWVAAQNAARGAGGTTDTNIDEGVGNNHGHVFMLGTKVRF